jgi:hypothetical protein
MHVRIPCHDACMQLSVGNGFRVISLVLLVFLLFLCVVSAVRDDRGAATKNFSCVHHIDYHAVVGVYGVARPKMTMGTRDPATHTRARPSGHEVR